MGTHLLALQADVLDGGHELLSPEEKLLLLLHPAGASAKERIERTLGKVFRARWT